ncbi:MAG: CPBP family intramembrane metalloprotease [Candidatus Omnitrophica bacterium]|nr:CPBP family intramembrane metalloprotease [Candidatus Omnitrophota bacterium]
MSIAAPFTLIVLMLCEGLLMFRQNRRLARLTLSYPYLLSGLWTAIALLNMAVGPGRSDPAGWPNIKPFLVLLFYLGIFPFYLWRRRRFFRADPRRPKGYLDGDDRPTRIYLGLEFFQICIIGFYGSMAIELILGLVFRLLGLDLPEIDELMISIFFSTIFALYIIYRSARKFSHHGFWHNVGFAGGLTWARSVFIPIIMGMTFALAASLAVMRNAGRQPQTPMSETLQTAQSSDTIFIFIGWAWLVAPVFEEIIFRGYFFHIFRKSLGRLMAVGLITLTFAVMHVPQYWGDWAAIFAVGGTGLGLTLLREWSGTTRASLIMHLVYNVGVTVIPAMMLTAQNPFYHQYSVGYGHLSVEEKERLLKQNIAFNPEYADAYNDLAWLYAEEQINVDAGLRLIDEALAMSPDNSAYKDTKAELLEVKGDLTQAMAIRQDIVETSYSDDMVDRQRERIERLEEVLAEEEEGTP